MHLLSRLPRWMHDRQQPLVAGLLVLSMLATSLGVPVLVAPPLDVSQPFPCMSHRCGCGSAAACWRGCCCMTLAQKLAWARDHGITPPAYVLAQVREETQKVASCGAGSCCPKRKQSSPVTNQETVKKHSPPPSVELGLVLVNDYRRCQGLSTLWLTLSHALPPRLETSAPRYRPAPGTWLAVTSQSAESLPLSPDTPPPRHS
jgi:hypothetical protein